MSWKYLEISGAQIKVSEYVRTNSKAAKPTKGLGRLQPKRRVSTNKLCRLFFSLVVACNPFR